MPPPASKVLGGGWSSRLLPAGPEDDGRPRENTNLLPEDSSKELEGELSMQRSVSDSDNQGRPGQNRSSFASLYSLGSAIYSGATQAFPTSMGASTDSTNQLPTSKQDFSTSRSISDILPSVTTATSPIMVTTSSSNDNLSTFASSKHHLAPTEQTAGFLSALVTTTNVAQSLPSSMSNSQTPWVGRLQSPSISGANSSRSRQSQRRISTSTVASSSSPAVRETYTSVRMKKSLQMESSESVL
jgi:inositol hexakisphosphate/diphosphoinositol-pentakisphosphate kinase